MRALSKKRRLQQITANQAEYQEQYSTLNFPAKKELRQARHQREKLLEQLVEGVKIGCHGTKLDMHRLSPGCQICVEGGWSCLFISGRCNCNCFYCPTGQAEFGLPTTNSVQFRHPADYVAYLERFGFSGASISGGEPLLTPGRSLGFLQAIKRHFGSKMHVWLYTNGALLTEDLVLQLRDAGLDEIRFDIGATDYKLQALKRASGVFPTLTVEIPAIPEEVSGLKGLLVELRDAGVQHLNLHQLRLTPYNFPRLQPRGYRYLHGDKVAVLDSELAALEILRFEREEKIGLPVNYCSFVYKNRFQARANRRHTAGYILKGHEALSENGYIRTLSLLGEKSQLFQQQELFIQKGIAPALFNLGRSGEQLSFHPVLWPLIALGGLRLLVGYASGRLRSSLSYHNPFVTVELSKRQKLMVERGRACPDFELDEYQAELFGQIFVLGFKSRLDLPNFDLWNEIDGFEQPRSGLQEYF